MSNKHECVKIIGLKNMNKIVMCIKILGIQEYKFKSCDDYINNYINNNYMLLYYIMIFIQYSSCIYNIYLSFLCYPNIHINII